MIVMGGRLEVCSTHSGDSSVLETLSSVLLYVWRLTKFSDSRWCTVGRSCGALTIALLSGIESLAAVVIADPRASTFHIGVAQRLVGNARRFVVMASICSYPIDSVVA